ncbi:hypothetical protein [Agriterribacter sp.]|uniref:hypothetical protein n=1 Tax=Agriterribacter sp. TaxID=2821509 RepID=UPI002B57FB0A|nr:hypothetical protein [Agriterribacter sp.]HTN05242.1 hypothetical protein [Agriterribacter sp.]
MNIAAPKYNIHPFSLQNAYFKSKKYLLLWTLIIGLLLVSFTNYPGVVTISLLLTFYCFGELILALGRIVPIKEITALLMVVQLLLAPYLDYTLLLPKKMSFMVVSQETYFSFAVPAVLAFLIGMRLRLGRSKTMQGTMSFNEADQKRNNKIGISLIIIGYIFLLMQNALVIPGLEFLIVVLALLRFVGIFYLMNSNNRFSRVLILAVVIPATISTVKGSVFIDLLIWFFFIYAFAAIKYRIKTTSTLIIVSSSMLFLMILQSVKMDYRKIEWSKNRVTKKATGVDLFTDIFSASVKSIDKNSLWIMQANFIKRLNQGFIVSYVLRKDIVNTTNKTDSYFSAELLGVLMPRFIYAEKATVGDNKKFRFLTGIPLVTSVAMNVGILGDGFGNFGYTGGILFCFGFGLFLNLAMGYCFTLSRTITTVLFWMPLIFFYVMRAGNEFYIITNWTVKVALVVIVYYYISKRIFGKPV